MLDGCVGRWVGVVGYVLEFVHFVRNCETRKWKLEQKRKSGQGDKKIDHFSLKRMEAYLITFRWLSVPFSGIRSFISFAKANASLRVPTHVPVRALLATFFFVNRITTVNLSLALKAPRRARFFSLFFMLSIFVTAAVKATNFAG